MTNGYAKTYEGLIPRLTGVDFAEAALRLGLDPPENGLLQIDFLRRRFEVGTDGVRDLTRDDDAYVNNKSVLIYYLTSGGFGEPQYRYSLLHHFSQGLFSGRQDNWMATPLIRKLSGDKEKFFEAMKRLGARYEGSRSMASHTWHYDALPKIPVEIYFYEADEEFSADVKMMFDDAALRFVPFETLAVLNGCLFKAISDRL